MTCTSPRSGNASTGVRNTAQIPAMASSAAPNRTTAELAREARMMRAINPSSLPRTARYGLPAAAVAASCSSPSVIRPRLERMFDSESIRNTPDVTT